VTSEDAFSMLAMIFYLFVAITTMTLYGLTVSNILFVLFERLSEILKMEEYQRKRVVDVPKEQRGVTI